MAVRRLVYAASLLASCIDFANANGSDIRNLKRDNSVHSIVQYVTETPIVTKIVARQECPQLCAPSSSLPFCSDITWAPQTATGSMTAAPTQIPTPTNTLLPPAPEVRFAIQGLPSNPGMTGWEEPQFLALFENYVIFYGDGVVDMPWWYIDSNRHLNFDGTGRRIAIAPLDQPLGISSSTTPVDNHHKRNTPAPTPTLVLDDVVIAGWVTSGPRPNIVYDEWGHFIDLKHNATDELGIVSDNTQVPVHFLACPLTIQGIPTPLVVSQLNAITASTNMASTPTTHVFDIPLECAPVRLAVVTNPPTTSFTTSHPHMHTSTTVTATSSSSSSPAVPTPGDPKMFPIKAEINDWSINLSVGDFYLVEEDGYAILKPTSSPPYFRFNITKELVLGDSDRRFKIFLPDDPEDSFDPMDVEVVNKVVRAKKTDRWDVGFGSLAKLERPVKFPQRLKKGGKVVTPKKRPGVKERGGWIPPRLRFGKPSKPIEERQDEPMASAASIGEGFGGGAGGAAGGGGIDGTPTPISTVLDPLETGGTVTTTSEDDGSGEMPSGSGSGSAPDAGSSGIPVGTTSGTVYDKFNIDSDGSIRIQIPINLQVIQPLACLGPDGNNARFFLTAAVLDDSDTPPDGCFTANLKADLEAPPPFSTSISTTSTRTTTPFTTTQTVPAPNTAGCNSLDYSAAYATSGISADFATACFCWSYIATTISIESTSTCIPTVVEVVPTITSILTTGIADLTSILGVTDNGAGGGASKRQNPDLDRPLTTTNIAGMTTPPLASTIQTTISGAEVIMPVPTPSAWIADVCTAPTVVSSACQSWLQQEGVSPLTETLFERTTRTDTTVTTTSFSTMEVCYESVWVSVLSRSSPVVVICPTTTATS